MSEDTPKYAAGGGNIRSALAIIAELRGGQAVTELSAEIHDAVAAVRQHGKKATVTLTLTIAPVSSQNNVEPAIIIVPDVDSKLPTPTPDATIFFVDDDGNPKRQAPPKERQTEFSVVDQKSQPQSA